MTGIDTNVLVRYLVRDDPEQARKAARFIKSQCSTDDPGLINRIVLCELVWVLETAYEYPRQAVTLALEKILRTAQFIIEDHSEAWLAFREYQQGADFADAFVGAINQRLGCALTVTFDKKASRRPGFRVL
ncbi:MAG: type II toxin-antitoxin system VapC family toxin [Verrucomicrobia bacterium]|nr:type II toxin-antitoxin system VapC family toxin [Verrucomicrobiota bacterium]